MKMKRKQKEDRLSLLPEGIFLEILSLIKDTRFVIQTCLLLSKRFANLWTFLPNLSLDGLRVTNTDHFDHFVVNVLQKSQLTKINSITFSRKFDPQRVRNLAEQVIIFSVLRQVEHFTLNLVNNFTIPEGYLQLLYTSNSLKTLSLTLCHNIPLDPWFLTEQLTSLRLRYSVIGESDFFSCFPNLKDLTLIRCILPFDDDYDYDYDDERMPDLKVFAPSLSQLIIANCSLGARDHDGPFRVVLTAPRLKVFRICYVGHPPLVKTDKLNLVKTAEVVYTKAVTTFNEAERELFDKMSLNVIHLLHCFPNAESISLSIWIIKLLSEMCNILAKEPSPFDNLRCLSIIIGKQSISSSSSNSNQSFDLGACVKTFLLKNSPDATINWTEKAMVQEL